MVIKSFCHLCLCKETQHAKLKPRGRQSVWIWGHKHGKCSVSLLTLLAELWKRALKSITIMLSMKFLGTCTHIPFSLRQHTTLSQLKCYKNIKIAATLITSEIILLITETDKQPAGSHGAGRGGVLPSMGNGVQEVLTDNPSCEEPATIRTSLPRTRDHFLEASFLPPHW